jgi:hypothetical protein
MADNINYVTGGVQTYFARFDCAPQGTQQELDDVTSPGVDYVAYRKAALRPAPFEGTTEVYVANFADAATLRALYDALVGKMVSITVQGVTYTNIIIIKAEVAPFAIHAAAYFVILPTGVPSSGTNAVRVNARWTFRYAGN